MNQDWTLKRAVAVLVEIRFSSREESKILICNYNIKSFFFFFLQECHEKY